MSDIILLAAVTDTHTMSLAPVTDTHTMSLTSVLLHTGSPVHGEAFSLSPLLLSSLTQRKYSHRYLVNDS